MSDPTSLPPVIKDTPYCGGSGVAGELLHCTMGNWYGEPVSYLYQWRRGNTPVGAGGDTYHPTALDVGFDISCIVTASNNVGTGVAPPSNAVTVTAAPPPPPPE